MITPIEFQNLNTVKYSNNLKSRIFSSLSWNMHYEIFQFLTEQDSLNLGAVSLTGFQLSTNLKHREKYFICDWTRSIIKNMSKIIDNNNIFVIERIARIKYLILQIGDMNFTSYNLRGNQISIYIIARVIQQLPALETLNLVNKSNNNYIIILL